MIQVTGPAQIVKRSMVGKRLNKLIPTLVPLYHHPTELARAKGGYMHKKHMQIFLDQLLINKSVNQWKSISMCNNNTNNNQNEKSNIYGQIGP
jgi:hypothetical protein